jgi:hypothetical protein
MLPTLSSIRLVSFLLLIFLAACQDPGIVLPPPVPAQRLYSFFVAGHVYGSEGVNNPGVHPPFKAQFPMIRADSMIARGFFLGDMVYIPAPVEWDEVDADAASLEIPVHYVAGNHDLINRPLFEARYGNTYYAFTVRKDLFVVLDGNLDGWNISGDQYAFLRAQLDSLGKQVNHVFVFSHQLLWYEPDSTFRQAHPNSLSGRSATPNFWTEVSPLLQALPVEVYCFAGDVGAFPWWDAFMYYHYDNVHLIATGMGNEKTDNFVVVDVWDDGIVSFRLIALNGEDVDALGSLEAYALP